MMRPIAARESEITELVAAVRLKRCSLYLVPPIRIERPSTSSALPMIDPVMDAFTTLVSPLDRAIPAMISSAAFPKVAFNNPPRPSPTRAASASVARPIQPATGMMAMAEQMKSAVGFAKAGTKRRTRAAGTKTSSQFSDGFNMMNFGSRISFASGRNLHAVRRNVEDEKPKSGGLQTAGQITTAICKSPLLDYLLALL